MMLWKVAVGALKTRGAFARILRQEHNEHLQCVARMCLKTRCIYWLLVMWQPWRGVRNLLVHQHTPVVMEVLIAGIRRRYAEHSGAWLGMERVAGRRWLPLPAGWFKIKTDMRSVKMSHILLSLSKILAVPSVWYTRNN